MPVLLVRILNQHDFGVYKQVFLFIGTATNFAAFSVGVSAFYYMPRQPQRGGQIALNILVYNLIAGLVPLLLLLFYPQFLTLISRSGDLEPYALMLGIFVMLQLNASLVEMIPTVVAGRAQFDRFRGRHPVIQDRGRGDCRALLSYRSKHRSGLHVSGGPVDRHSASLPL